MKGKKKQSQYNTQAVECKKKKEKMTEVLF